MPTYDFFCRKCSKLFEDFVAYEVRDQVRCPTCKSLAERQISSFRTTAPQPSVDTLIGRDSQKRWRQIEKREKAAGRPFKDPFSVKG